jgi:hypothetical protein
LAFSAGGDDPGDSAGLLHRGDADRAARDRKKAATGKCGGRKSYAEAHPEVAALANPTAAFFIT